MRHRPEVRELSEEGIALSDKNDLKGAIEKFDAAIKVDPTFAEPLFYRGRALLQLKQTGRARADIEAGLAIEPGLGWHIIDTNGNICGAVEVSA